MLLVGATLNGSVQNATHSLMSNSARSLQPDLGVTKTLPKLQYARIVMKFGLLFECIFLNPIHDPQLTLPRHPMPLNSPGFSTPVHMAPARLLFSIAYVMPG